MTDTNKYDKRLFEELNASDFDIVIQDLELQEKGVFVHYVVDAYDVLEYCFPFGVEGNKEKTLERVGDEQLAYWFLFFQNRPVLLDEYKSELFSNTRRALTSDGRHYLLKKLIEDYEKAEGEERNKLLVKLAKNFSFFISAIVYSSSATDFYKSLFSDRLMSGEGSPRDAVDGTLIYNTFIRTSPTDISRQWLSSWHDRNKIDLKDKAYIEVFEKLKKVYRDLVAIERLMIVNKELTAKPGNKHLFLYFSSILRSEEFFEKDESIKDIVEINLKELKKSVPGFEVSPKTVLRQVKHAYLLFLSQTPDGEADKVRDAKFYAKWKENIIKIKEFRQITEKFDQQSFQQWRSTNLHYALQLEQQVVANQVFSTPIHETFKRRLEEGLTFIKDSQFEELKDFVDLQVKNHVKTDPRYLDESPSYRTVTSSYALQNRFSHILRILEAEKKMIVEPGDDYIVSLYHHLPVLLYYRQSLRSKRTLSSDAIGLTQKIAGYISSSDEKRAEINKKFIEDIEEYLDTDDKQVDDDPQTQLLNLFLLQIAPFPEKQRLDVRKKSVDYVQAYYEFYEIMIKRFYYDKDKKQWETIKIEDDPDNDLLLQEIEILYVKAWFERRNKNYDESINTCRKGIEIGKKYDPRFIHGICLAEFCKYIDMRDNSMDDLARLEKCIRLCNDALALYAKNLLEPFKGIVMQLLEGTFATIHNLKRYLEACLFILRKHYYFSFDEKELLSSMNSSSIHIETFMNKHDHTLHAKGDVLRPEYLALVCDELAKAGKNEASIQNAITSISDLKGRFTSTFKKPTTGKHKTIILDLFDKAIETLKRLKAESANAK